MAPRAASGWRKPPQETGGRSRRNQSRGSNKRASESPNCVKQSRKKTRTPHPPTRTNPPQLTHRNIRSLNTKHPNRKQAHWHTQPKRGSCTKHSTRTTQAPPPPHPTVPPPPTTDGVNNNSFEHQQQQQQQKKRSIEKGDDVATSTKKQNKNETKHRTQRINAKHTRHDTSQKQNKQDSFTKEMGKPAANRSPGFGRSLLSRSGRLGSLRTHR